MTRHPPDLPRAHRLLTIIPVLPEPRRPIIVRAPARHGRLVEPDGLAALRLALAMARDPQLGGFDSAIAFRSMPRPRGEGGSTGSARTSVATMASVAATT